MNEADAEILIAFGKRLRAVWVGLHVTQETLADLADLDRTYKSLLERGKRNPSLVCVASLARALYQGALVLAHGRASQAVDFVIPLSKHEEACNGGSDWGSIRFHADGFAPVFATMR